MMNADKLEKGEAFVQNTDETQRTVELQETGTEEDRRQNSPRSCKKCALVTVCSTVSCVLLLGLIYWIVSLTILPDKYEGTYVCNGCKPYVNGKSFESVSVDGPAQVQIVWGDAYNIETPDWYWAFQEESTMHVYRNEKVWTERGYNTPPNWEQPPFVETNVTVPSDAAIKHLYGGGSGRITIADFSGGDLTAKGSGSGSVTLVNATIGDLSASGGGSGGVHIEGGSIEKFSGHAHGSGYVELVNVKVGCIKKISEGGSGWVRFKDANGEEIDRSTIPKC